MIAIGHIAAGYIVGNSVVNNISDPPKAIVVGFLIGIASHYILDFIPHGHFGKKAEFTRLTLNTIFIYLDALGGLFLFFGLAFRKFGLSFETLVVLVSIFGAILPDLVSAFDKIFFKNSFKSGFLKNEHDFHTSTHWHGKGNNTLLMSVKDVWQVALVVLAFFS